MANDGLWGSSGERMQSWIRRRKLAYHGRTDSRGLGNISNALGLIVARYFKDETGNKSQTYTEYDVLLVNYQVQLNRLPMRMPYQGFDGGTQITLHPATSLPDFANPVGLYQAVMESDGDLVSVSYIGGRFPVIDGCVNHIRTADGAPWETDSSDGEVSSHFYNTTRTRINSDGNIEVDFDDTGGAHDRSLIINVDGIQFLKVAQDGASGEVRIELGQGAVEKLVLGDAFKTWFDANVSGHTHIYAIPDHTSATGPTGGAVPVLDPNILTEKAKVEP